MRYEGRRWQFDLPLPSLSGAHQIVNSGTAIACLEQLPGFPIAHELIARGLRQIEWPARLQRLTRGPLVAALPAGWELWLDGGHNPGAGEVLAAAVSNWVDRPLYLIVGMLNTKNAAGFLAPLAPRRALHAVTIPGEDNPLPAAKSPPRPVRSGSRRESPPSPPRLHDSRATSPRDRHRPDPDLRLAPSRRHRARRKSMTIAGETMRGDGPVDRGAASSRIAAQPIRGKAMNDAPGEIAATLDATGLICPLPVLKARRALEAARPRCGARSAGDRPGRGQGFRALLSDHRLPIAEIPSEEFGGLLRFRLRKPA